MSFRISGFSNSKCKIQEVVKTNLLTFEAFPEKVVLEGFDDQVLSGLGTFFARISDGGVGDAAYRVVAVGGGGPRRSIEGAAPHPRRPWHRHFRRDGEDVLVMPGGRVRLTPGRAKAVVEWTGTGAAVDGFAATALLEVALGHALAMGGCVVNHAAALVVDGMELLVVGPSCAGKSTLSAAVLAAGGTVVSDDSVILGKDGDVVPCAGALRRNLWLREGGVELLPETLRARLWEAESMGERRWGLERAAAPELFRTSVRPRAIVLLRRDLRVRGFTLQRVDSAEGLAGLILASSPLFLSGRYQVERERCMSGLLALVNGAPCFAVRMGRALVEDPEVTVRRLFEDVCR